MAVTCNVCNKIYQNQSNLNRHFKNVHNVTKNAMSYDKNVYNYKCLEEQCNTSYRYSLNLIGHLKSEHAYNIDEEEIKIFPNMEEFNAWKIQIENREKCNYVITRGIQRLSSGEEKIYYVCNRSGNYTKKAVKKTTKSQGTCKLNRSCISQINVTKQLNGTILVQRQKSHYGHSNDIQHLRISKEDRNVIANKLLEGVSKSRILDSFRTKITKDIKRVDLVTLKDIENVERDFKLSIGKIQKHKEDAVSIDLWVHENIQGENSQVLYYKKQGEHKDSFEVNDFCLILMNSYQKLMLTTFGKNIIAIDSTHGLNQYDFELTTVMVVDDYQEGFPVAYMFTNRKDTFVHITLFEVIKSNVGILKTKTFMTDMSDVFYNAWTCVMGTVEHQLYCSWHVDRAWQTNLTKISNKEKRSWVYKTIKVLQQNIDSKSFMDQMNTAIDSLLNDPDTNKFGVYFNENYARHFTKWAYCYRKDCGINTNMILESMHKCIKYFYLNRKMVKRLDKGLHAVMQYTRNKMVDRLVKQIKGKNTGRKKDITKRHRTAVVGSLQIEVSSNDQNQWKISHENASYHVQKVSSIKCCQIECNFCNICLHMYKCSCPDFFIRATICKHIHFLCINSEKQSNINKNPMKSDEVSNNIQMCLSELNSEISNKNNLKEKLIKELSAFNAKIATNDIANINDEILSQMLGHIRNASTLLDLKKISSNEFVSNSDKSSSNKHIPKQLSFCSTKKKQSPREREKKANETEVKIINNLLSGNKVAFISNDVTNDHKYC